MRDPQTRTPASMTQPSEGPLSEPSGERPRTGRLMQGLLIVAIMVLIAVALVMFN
jgi:hypothetical protein